MVIQTINVNNCQPQTIVIGRRGTYNTLQIAFDLSYLVESYGNGVAVLAVKRSQDESAYPAIVTQEDNTLTWTISDTDTYYVGSGECQLMWYVDGGLAKTIIYPMVVMRDILATSEEAPEAYQTWVDDLTALGAETLQNAQDAAQSASDAESAKDDAVTAKKGAKAAQEAAETAVTHYPKIENNYWMVWDSTSQSYVSTGIQAEGEDGYSPEITITSITGGHRVIITDKDHPQGQSFDVLDGQGGGGTSDYTDLTNKPQINGHTLTGNQTAEQLDLATPSDIPTDAGDIEYDESATYQAGSVGAELQEQNRHLSATDVSVGLSFSGDYAPYYQFGWQNGDSTSGTINPTRKYRVTSQIFKYKSPVTLVLDDGYQLYTVIYNDDGTVKNTISFRSAIMVSADQKVSITIKKTSEDASIVLDVSEVLSHLHFLFANCGDYLLFYGNPNNASAISNPVYTRIGSDLISGKIGRLNVRANGYRHFLQTFEADGTKLTDTNFVSGDYEYALDVTRSYKIWFARIDNSNIDADDIGKNVAVFMQRSGVPDIVSLNESQMPYIQQLFGGRPSLIGTDHELAFVHFSDVHRSQTNWNRVMQFAKYFSGNMSFAIHTGDFVAGDQRGYTNLYESGFDSGIPELNVVGNHDVYTDFANKTMAAKSVTKSLIFPDTSDWGVTWGADADPMNYYKDFATEKIRLVVLDCYYDTESQASWLATVLSGAKSLGYAVITATHEVTKSLTEFVNCTFTTKDVDALTAAGLNHSSTPYDAVIKAFKDSGGEHICNLCGHEHVDIIGYSENGILNVVIGTSLGYDATSSDVFRAENTRTFDLFNAVSVNKNQHLIKIVRIGANTDHYLQGRNVLCYDYINRMVVSNH